MTASINMKFIFIAFLLTALCDLSFQRPSDSVTSLSPNGLAIPPHLPNLDSLPAFQLLKTILARHNQVADAMLPVMVRALTNLAPGLAETLQRSMALFGVTSYLVGPTIARSARNLSPVMEPLVGTINTEPLVQRINQISELKPLLEETMALLGINNDQCKETLTCLAGKTVAHDFPVLAGYLTQATGALSSNDDKFASMLIQTMGSKDSHCINSCPNLVKIGKYWDESKEKELKAIAQEAFSDLLRSFNDVLFNTTAETNRIPAITNPSNLNQ